MKKQKDMVDSFQLNHKDFMTNLNDSLNELDRDISEAQEIDSICTGEWCRAIERDLDDLSNAIFSLSEPRFSCSGHSKKIARLRTRLHDIYEKYRGVQPETAH